MKAISTLILAASLLTPTVASAEYLCEKMWNKKYNVSCPAGTSLDPRTYTCIVNG